MKPVTHHFTERQIEWLKAEARRTGLTVAELIRRAVDAYMDRVEKRKGKP